MRTPTVPDLLASWPSDLLTTTEVCAALDAHRSSVARWVRSGRLKPVRKLPGRQGAYVFALEDVREFAATARRRRRAA